MTEHDEMRMEYTNMDEQKPIVTKWIYVLLICNIASIIVTALNSISAVSVAAGWIARVISVVMLVALFHLSAVNERYRKAAIFAAVSVGGSIVTALLDMNLFVLLFSVCAIVANYQQMNAHSELVVSRDSKLSRRWKSLFYYELVAGILSGFLSSAAVVIAVLVDVDAEVIVSATVAVFALFNVIIGMFRVIYLKQTLSLYRK